MPVMTALNTKDLQDVRQCAEAFAEFEDLDDLGREGLRMLGSVPGTGHKVSVYLQMIRCGPRPYLLVLLDPKEPALSLTERLREMGLTRRETHAALLLAQGFRNAQIAGSLCISGTRWTTTCDPSIERRRWQTALHSCIGFPGTDQDDPHEG